MSKSRAAQRFADTAKKQNDLADHTHVLGEAMTTKQGLPISDDQNSLKDGVRGPTLLEDLYFRENITHLDHERIPERVVDARGVAAHGYFECTADASDITQAFLFGVKGKRKPVFVRFSALNTTRSLLTGRPAPSPRNWVTIKS